MDAATIALIVSIVVPIVVAVLKELIPIIIDQINKSKPQPTSISA